MPVSKKQLVRLIKLVAQLKENRYPNCSSFAEVMHSCDLQDNINIACSSKTIQRDIHVLKEDFGAPIKFDASRNGYYLTDHTWKFSCPQIFNDNLLLSAVLGARLAEHIFPEPMKSQIRQSVDYWLTSNNPDFLDQAQVDSLVVIPFHKVKVDPEIFLSLFNGWQQHKICHINYCDSKGQITERDFEPHTLVFFEGIWYTKGYCLTRKDIRTLVLPRIMSVYSTDRTFTPRKDIIKSVSENFIFDSEMVNDVKIHCDNYLTKFIETRPLHPGQTVIEHEDGTSEIFVKLIPRYKLIPWIMHQCGRAELIEPVSLRKEIRTFANRIAEKSM